jgi:biopolymer transport protein ExbD
MRLPEEPDTPFQINIVPMIDIIFAILAFFIISTLFLTASQGLPVDLPAAETAATQPQTQLIVTITPQGQIFLNEQSMNLDTLETQVRSLLEQGLAPLVIINADETTYHGRVVAVMDRLRSLDGVSLAIGTAPPSTAP